MLNGPHHPLTIVKPEIRVFYLVEIKGENGEDHESKTPAKEDGNSDKDSDIPLSVVMNETVDEGGNEKALDYRHF